MKYAFIERHRRDWPVSIQCSVLDVSASGFQQYLRRAKMPDKGAGRVSDMALLTHIKAIHAETRGAYGWPRIWRELRHRGLRVGKERVRRMMRDNAIRARSKRKYKATTDSNHGLPVSDNLLNRNFQPERPDLVWTGDITYIATAGRLVVPGRRHRPVQPAGGRLGDGRAHDTTPRDRCPDHGVVPTATGERVDLPFGSRLAICQCRFPGDLARLRHARIDEPEGQLLG